MNQGRSSFAKLTVSVCLGLTPGCGVESDQPAPELVEAADVAPDDVQAEPELEVLAGVSVIVPPAGMRVTVEVIYDDGHMELANVSTGIDGEVRLQYPDNEWGILAPTPAAASCPHECGDDRFSLLGWHWTSPLTWRYRDAGRPVALNKTATISAFRDGAWASQNARNSCGIPDNVSALHSNPGETNIAPSISVVDGEIFCTSFDTDNVMGWGSLPSHILGVACTWSTYSGLGVGSDMLFNNSMAWFTGNTPPAGCTNQYSLRAVAAHEFGHAFGLGHSPGNSCNLTMYPSLWACSGDKRNLGLGDVLGLEELYTFCSPEARYATGGGGTSGFCLFENIELPNAVVKPYCHYLQDGYIGYSWTVSPQTATYVCPNGARLAGNGAGTDFCLFEDLPLPDATVSPYCQYLDLGYLGYHWPL